MNQGALFHDSLGDAIGADIAAAGGFKVVAAKLWPAESNSAQKLRNCLNDTQPHKLSPDEVLQIKRFAYEHGSTCTVDYEAQQLGYQCTWIEPEDQSEKLNREVRDLLALVNRKLDLKAKADERMRVVK